MVDVDRDGRPDQFIVFADKLGTVSKIEVTKDGVRTHENGQVFLLKDIDGDLKADSRERLSRPKKMK